jgi:molybdate transport repressor ModE-like protein
VNRTLATLLFRMANRSESFRWVGVELRHLLALKTVADEGSLAAAARSLGYSQPAVSQQIASLEKLVGSRLVERRAGGREIELTEAGRRTLRHGRALLARAQAADAELRALQDGTQGTLRLGTNPSVGARIVPQLLRHLAEQLPQIEIELVEDPNDERLLDRLEAGELELTFAFPPLQRPVRLGRAPARSLHPARRGRISTRNDETSTQRAPARGPATHSLQSKRRSRRLLPSPGNRRADPPSHRRQRNTRRTRRSRCRGRPAAPPSSRPEPARCRRRRARRQTAAADHLHRLASRPRTTSPRPHSHRPRTTDLRRALTATNGSNESMIT